MPEASRFPAEPEQSRTSAAAEFDACAGKYAELLRDPIRDWFASDTGFYLERKLALILDFLRSRGLDARHLKWLDVGCGQGLLLKLGQSHFSESAGCDVSERMIEACMGLNVCRQESATALPFPDRSFDLITAVCVYHHVPVRLRPALTLEAARVLKSGGVFCVIEHNPLNPIVQIIVSRSPLDANAALVRARPMKRLLRSAGMELAGLTYYLYVPARMYARLACLENRLARIPLGGQYTVFGRVP